MQIARQMSKKEDYLLPEPDSSKSSDPLGMKATS